MPLKGVQNWVNGWVNVNNNHVVFHEDDSGPHHRTMNGESEDRQRVSFEGQSRGGGDPRGMAAEYGRIPVIGDGRAILDSRGGGNFAAYGLRPMDSRKKYEGVSSSASKSRGSNSTVNSDIKSSKFSQQQQQQQQQLPQQVDIANNPIKNSFKKNHKKVKLKKTNSQSDLLREIAKSKRQELMLNDRAGIGGDNVGIIDTIAGLTQHIHRGVETTRKSSTTTGSGSTSSTNKRDNKIQQTPMREVRSSTKNASPPFRSTGQYINEKAFANQHRSSQLSSTYDESSNRSNSRMQRRGAASNSSAGSNPSSHRSSNPSAKASHQSSDYHATHGPEPLHINNWSSTKPGQNPPMSSSMAGSAIHDQGFAAIHQTQMPHNNNKTKIHLENNCGRSRQQNEVCLHCKEADDKIQALESDLEYLRLVALKSEFTCVECDNNSHNNNMPRVNSSVSLASGKTSKSNRSNSRVSVASGKHSMTSGMYSSTTGTSKRKDKKGRHVFVDGMNHKLPEPVALAESSQRLMDVTARYKRQIENMTRETVSLFVILLLKNCFYVGGVGRKKSYNNLFPFES